MHSIQTNTTRLEIRLIAGSNRLAPIVFLHEGLGCISLWNQRGNDWPLAVCEATGRAGLVYSRRGYGQSESAGRTVAGGEHPPLLSPDYMHREAREVLPELLACMQSQGRGQGQVGQPDFQKPVLLGHSDGASIALIYASAFPVTACIAMAPHVMVEDIAITAIGAAKTAFETGGLRERLAKHHADAEGAFWQWNDVWLSAAFRTFDIRKECAAIAAPLLLIQGLQDEYGTLQQLDEIAQAARHARQLRLENCGHSPQRDQPLPTLTAVRDFLAHLD